MVAENCCRIIGCITSMTTNNQSPSTTTRVAIRKSRRCFLANNMNPKPKCYIARKEDVTTALINRAGLQAIAVYPDGNVDHLNNSMMKVEIGPGLMQNVTLDKNQ